MNDRLVLINMLLAIAVIAFAFVLSIVAIVFEAEIFVFVIVPIIIEVGFVIIILRKKSFRLIRLAFLLFLANIFTFSVFIIEFSSQFIAPPFVVFILSSALVIVFEALTLVIATELTIFRKPQGSPLKLKGALNIVIISNVVYIMAFFLIVSAYMPTSKGGWGWWDYLQPYLKPVEQFVRGQGTWETTLVARDLDNDTATIEAYYDTVLGITWLKDANYAKTIGDHADGRMSWTEANAWVTGLNISGVAGWRLPKFNPINGIAFNIIHSNDATTDNGYAPTTTDGTDGGWRDGTGNPVSEMGHMYYVTLGNISRCSTEYNDRCVMLTNRDLYDAGILTTRNLANFTNIKLTHYWANPETDYNPNLVTAFRFNNGNQGFFDEIENVAYVWAVHDGDVGTPLSK